MSGVQWLGEGELASSSWDHTIKVTELDIVDSLETPDKLAVTGHTAHWILD